MAMLMTGPGTVFARCGYALLVAGLLWAPGVSADYKHYQKGLDAQAAGDWQSVRQRMKQSLESEPRPRKRVRLYGMRFVPYLPHYYLGLANFHLQDCKKALASWRAAQDSGVIQGFDENQTLNTHTKSCQSRLAKLNPQPARRTTGEAKVTPPSRPPQALRKATDRFFAGDYSQTLSILGKAHLEGKQARYFDRIFRAAASYQLAEMATDSKRSQLRRQALQHVKKAKSLSSGRGLDKNAFSPKFIRFYARGR